MKTLVTTLALAAFTLGVVPAIRPAQAAPVVAERCGCTASKAAPVAHAKKPKAGASATCPVMKQSFTVGAKTELSFYKGKWYAFCCAGCKPKFDANPAKYAGR